MNNRYLKFLQPALLLGLILIAPALFTSCDNFLHGSDVKQQLEELIAYENAMTHNFFVKSDSRMGSFLTDGKNSCKLGFTTELQFNLNKDDYILHGFEAVNVNAEDQSRSDCVNFTINKAESDEQRGIYKVSVKLLKPVDDILIRPVCVVIPAVESYEPASLQPNYLNSPIIIHFNTAMEAEDVKPGDSIFNYDNISINCSYLNNRDMTDCFETPVFDASKTVLILQAKGGQLRDCFFDRNNTTTNLPYFDLDISIKNISISQTIQGKEYDIPLKSNNSSEYSFTARYKFATEADKPIQLEFLATRHEISINTVHDLDPDCEFFYGNIDVSQKGALETGADINTAELNGQFHNRTNGIIYIYGRYYDEGSGVRTIKIEEHRTNTPFDYSAVNKENEEDTRTYYTITDNNIDSEWIDDGFGNVTFCIKHKMKSLNGAVTVKITAMDAGGNAPNKYDIKGDLIDNEFIVIKKDFKDFYEPGRYNFNLYNGGFDLDTYNFYLKEKYLNEKAFNTTEYNEKLKEFVFQMSTSIYGFCGLYGTTMLPRSYITIKCKYTNTNREETIKTLEPYDEYFVACEYWEWGGTLDINQMQGNKIILIISDELGNEEEVEYIIPETSTISYVLNENTEKAGLISSTGERFESVILIKNDLTAEHQDVFYNDLSISMTDKYKICPRYILDHGYFYTEIPDFSFGSNSQTSLLNRELQDCAVSISKAYHDGSCLLDVNLSVSDDSWNYYDSIYVDFSEAFYLPERETDVPRYIFPKGITSSKIAFYNDLLFENEYTCTFYGVKDNCRSSGVTKSFGPVSGIEYDNIPPEYEMIPPTYQNNYFSFTIEDALSGADYAIVTLNGKNFRFSESVKINLNDIYISPEEDITGNIVLYDRSGNVGYETLFINPIYWPTITKYDGTNLYITSIKSYSSLNTFNDGKIIYYTLNSASVWSNEQIIDITRNTVKEDVSSGNEFSYKLKNITMPSNSWIKVIHRKGGCFSYPTYIYTGTAGSGTNMLLPHRNTDYSYAVFSNAPVFVHTMVTDLNYNECKDWTAQEWECFKKDVEGSNAVISLSNSNSGPVDYYIPIDNIASKQCYCVIAHFADGTTDMSDVMQKP